MTKFLKPMHGLMCPHYHCFDPSYAHLDFPNLKGMHQEKKNLPMIFHLGTCAIGMCLVLLAGHWQAIGKWGNKLAANCLILYQLAGNGTSGTIGWMPYCLRPQYVIFSWGAIFACTHT